MIIFCFWKKKKLNLQRTVVRNASQCTMDCLRGEAALCTSLCSDGSTPLPVPTTVSLGGLDVKCVYTFDHQLVVLSGEARAFKEEGLSRKKWVTRRALQFLFQPLLCFYPLVASWSTQAWASSCSHSFSPYAAFPSPSRIVHITLNCEAEQAFLPSAAWARYFITATRKMTNVEVVCIALSLSFMKASIRRKLLSIYSLLGMAFENEGTMVNKPAAAVTVESYLLREDRMKDCMSHSYYLRQVWMEIKHTEDGC